MKNCIRLLATVVLAALLAAGPAPAAGPGPAGAGGQGVAMAAAKPDADLLRTAYGGGESLRYEVSWLGIRAGELSMRIVRQQGDEDSFVIEVTVKSAGLLAVLYPVEDHFTTTVSGSSRLPRRYEMLQKEGSRQNTRVTVYDQAHGRITYSKNDDPAQIFEVDGPVYNEFSAFLFLRVMSFAAGENTVVPTFADKKRHPVAVSLEGREKLKTILGSRETIEVRPHLSFKGLYQKVGDPLIWLTDDPARIPVKIKAKIVIGSLTGRLVAYQGTSGSFTAANR